MKKLALAVVVFICSFVPAVALQSETALELKYAVVVTRHGVRSPTWTAERLNQYSSESWPDFGVPPGNLTPHGRELMKQMGEYYRQYFSAEKLLGQPQCADAARVYFWADTDQRTMETARALAESILPGCRTDVHSAGPEGKTDPLFDPAEAGVVKPDWEMARAAVAGRMGPTLDAIVDANRTAFDMLNRVLNGNGKASMSIFAQPMSLSATATGASMSGPLNFASTFTENLLLEYTDGMSGRRFGWGRLSVSDLEQIMSLHTTYAELMRRTPYLARTRGSNLLNYVLQAMNKAATGKAGNALMIISGHDTNLSNLSAMLDLSWLLPSYQPNDVPPGGALVFSLWQAAGDSRQFVRLQFMAQTLDQMHEGTTLSMTTPPAIADIFVPGCSAASPGFRCEWTAFQKAAAAAIDPAFVQ
jgi:4-phytase/acid phosphatase